MKEHIYKVKGMHCASCEILIEKKLLEAQNIKSVDASAGNGEVVVEYEGDRPNPERLNKIFREENYKFFDETLDSRFRGNDTIKNGNDEKNENGGNKASPTLVAFNIAIFIIIAFLFLQKILEQQKYFCMLLKKFSRNLEKENLLESENMSQSQNTGKQKQKLSSVFWAIRTSESHRS